MEKEVLNQEKSHLSKVLSKVTSARDVISNSLDNLGSQNLDKLQELRNSPDASSADFMMFVQQLHEANESFNVRDKIKRLEELEFLAKEPYFARLDISNDQEEKKLYIGKFGYTEKDPVIIDWRAKVASLYYRYRYPQKDVKYKTNEGEFTYDLDLKRTYEISEGELIKYFNNDIQLDEDSIISDKIQERTGGVLEDIIETIQENQLDIIESDPRKVCIVQGCVGSGKSTVAIHKLSHIFFNYPQLIQPERAILVAKNGILVSYLSTLFPKLGIFDINYKTLRDLIVTLLFREEIKVDFDLDKNEDLSDVNLDTIKKLEASLQKIHDDFQARIEKVTQKENYNALNSFVYSNEMSISENIDSLIDDLNEELLYQKDRLKENERAVTSWIHKENIDNIRKLNTSLRKINKDLKEKTLKKIYVEWGINFKEALGYKELLILMYIHFKLFGFKKTLKYQYCVVDEGQDLNVLEYLVLSKFVLNGRFCILGDLNQGYVTDGLTTWDDISAVVSEAKQAVEFELDTNYRSTQQIISLANRILSPYTKDYLPKSINRVGPEPKMVERSEINDMMLEFGDELRADLENLDKSIGIICLNDEVFELAQEKLYLLKQEFKIPADRVIKLDSESRLTFNPKAAYITKFEDCKGLEFAKVYVLGLDLKDVKDFTEAKRAFVAVTRAMNELSIYSKK